MITTAQLYSLCKKFEGVMDPSYYKDYILSMFFLKCISDAPEQLGFDLERDFYYLYAHRKKPNIGKTINQVFFFIERTHLTKLKGLFSLTDWNSDSLLGGQEERNKRIRQLLEGFYNPEDNDLFSRDSDDIPLGNLGDSYMELVERFGTMGKRAGEFFTPSKVGKLLIRFLKPSLGSSIYDPTCGAGGLLLRASESLEGNCTVYGAELNHSTFALCKMNMLLHNIQRCHILQNNSLINKPLLDAKDNLLKFDSIAANPPFSVSWKSEDFKNDIHNTFRFGKPPESKADLAFLSHMISVAKEKTGKIVTILPPGVLYRGNTESKIRKNLIKANLIDAVISLPANLFPGTPISVIVMILDRSREKGGVNEELKNILFIDASKDFAKSGKINILTDAHIEKIVEAYEKRETIERYASIVEDKELEKNDYNLNTSLYVDASEEKEPVDIEKLEKSIVELRERIVKNWDETDKAAKAAKEYLKSR